MSDEAMTILFVILAFVGILPLAEVLKIVMFDRLVSLPRKCPVAKEIPSACNNCALRESCSVKSKVEEEGRPC